ncbi:hypothetical protein AVEN_3976-1 [Araneus ventricosus]|uniref:Uncharacterized protein n=1 Tax=Araneus ventricosus TaxID=182803 RepID=A0A4Y2LHZ1_ARAVE|nr:hypothetical protein AVEN_3976-1 [Araneus ventricosus]
MEGKPRFKRLKWELPRFAAKARRFPHAFTFNRLKLGLTNPGRLKVEALGNLRALATKPCGNYQGYAAEARRFSDASTFKRLKLGLTNPSRLKVEELENLRALAAKPW